MPSLPSPPSGVNLSIQQLIDAVLYKCKYANDQLSELPESELDRLDRKLHIAASAVRGFRNACQKINQLPAELLGNILESVQERATRSFLPDLTMYRDYGREWCSLLHVCRRWRGIIARAPPMWSTVDDTVVRDGGSSISRYYLDRSAGTPLTVYIGVNSANIQWDAVETLLKHTSRFKEFHLCADSWYFPSPIYNLLVDPAPSLVGLSILTRGGQVNGGFLPPIFAGEMPLLREVALEHFTSWPTNYFHNLSSLYLLNQVFFSRPTTLAFLDFLENSPRLQKLAVVRAGPTLPLNSDILPAVDRIVRFPNMRQVTLGDWPMSAVSRFLSYISLPHKANVYIYCSEHWDPQIWDPDTHRTPLLSLPVDITNLDNIQGITKWYLSNFSFGGRPEESFTFYNPYTAIVGSSNALYHHGQFQASKLLATLPGWPIFNVVELVLRDWSVQDSVPVGDRFTTENWVEVFGKLKSLESLRIVDTPMPRNILMALLPAAPMERKRTGADRSTRKEAGTSTTSVEEECKCRVGEEPEPPLVVNCSQCEVLCPKLSTLRIEHDPALDSLLVTKLLRSRSNHGYPISSLIILDDAIPPARPCSPHSGHHRHRNRSSPSDSSRTVDSQSSIGIVGEEYYIRIKEEEDLLRQYVKDFRLELDQPMSDVFVASGWPEGWPEDVYTFSRF